MSGGPYPTPPHRTFLYPPWDSTCILLIEPASWKHLMIVRYADNLSPGPDCMSKSVEPAGPCRTSVVVLSLVFLILSAVPVGDARRSQPDPSAKRLHYDLMSRYQALVKPSAGANNLLTVKMGLRLSQVLDVVRSSLLSVVTFTTKEYDSELSFVGRKEPDSHYQRVVTDRLQWDPNDYDGLAKINIPSDDLWKPDLVLYNNADGDFVVTLKTKASVYHDGKIVWEPPAIFKSYCPINVEYFPFDIQECFLKFSTWSYDGTERRKKVTLAISILLALTVFFLLLSDMNPPTSLVIPLIGKYLLFIMIVVTASIILTVYTLHINFKNPSTDRMSPWVKKIFTEILPRALMMKRPDLDEMKRKMPPLGVAAAAALPPRAVNSIEAQDVPSDEVPLTYENLRQRHESGESASGSRASSSTAMDVGGTKFPPEVVDALKGVRFIANHLRQGDEDLAIRAFDTYLRQEGWEERDWKYICMVIDRLFLYIFTSACFCGTLSIFLCAPSLYDPRAHMELVDPNSTCQY
nr:hypothetical protein BaRGS_025498 [Batillaria attramentaria]